MSETLLKVEEVAERLRVHTETVRRWLRSGELRGVRLGRKAGYRVAGRDLDEFLRRRVTGKAN